MDADNHFYPTVDAIDRYLDPKMRDRALVKGETFALENEEDIVEEKHVDATTWKTVGEHPVPEGGHGGVDMSEVPGMDANIPIPGAMLNRLNPMKDLDNLSRAELVQRYNEMRPAFEHKDPRLALMDFQGVEAAVVHAGGAPSESAFRRGDVEAGYAVARAFNQWLEDDWGFAYREPHLRPGGDPAERHRLRGQGAGVGAGARRQDHQPEPGLRPQRPLALRALLRPVLGPHQRGRACASPSTSAARTTRSTAPTGARTPTPSTPSTTPSSGSPTGRTARSWRPSRGVVFHNLFGRFPNVKVLIAEFGTPWLPYIVRKMDHAALLGRPAKFGKLPGRPSRIFKEHFVVAPFPEENIQRPMEIVGPDVLVFGSDFPHAEGLPDPVQYATQLKGLDDVTVKKIMRDNLANFLGI